MEEALIKRILPHSIEAEQSVIGSMILDRDAILVASEILTSDDFYQKQYGIIFDAMVELCNEGKPENYELINIVMLCLGDPESKKSQSYLTVVLKDSVDRGQCD